MRTFICGNLLILFLCGIAFADNPIQKIEVAPLTGGISFNTITFTNNHGYTGWITANSVIGRKEVLIHNTSTTENIYVSGISGSTAIGTIYPRESVTFKAASSLNIYVSSSTTTLSVQVWEIR